MISEKVMMTKRQRIHETGIFTLHEWLFVFSMVAVGNYASFMDPMGTGMSFNKYLGDLLTKVINYLQVLG